MQRAWEKKMHIVATILSFFPFHESNIQPKLGALHKVMSLIRVDANALHCKMKLDAFLWMFSRDVHCKVKRWWYQLHLQGIITVIIIYFVEYNFQSCSKPGLKIQEILPSPAWAGAGSMSSHPVEKSPFQVWPNTRHAADHSRERNEVSWNQS